MDWESDKEEEKIQFQPQPHPTLSIQLKQPANYQCDILIVSLYGAASLFAHSLIGQARPVNRINFSKAKQQSLADIYERGNLYFIVFNDQLPAMHQIHFAKFIDKTISFKKSIILTAVSRNTLRDTKIANLTIMSTSSFEDNAQIDRFSQGLGGVAAQLLQAGEIEGRPSCCYVGTLGEYELSSAVIEQVFGSLRGKHGLSGNHDISEKVRKFNMKKYSNKLYL